MKIKRAIPLLVSLVMVGGAFSGMLAGCTDKGGNGGDNPPEPGHTHHYTNWHNNGDGTHSPECSGKSDPECDAPVKTDDKQAHDKTGADGACSKCGYKEQTGGTTHTHTYLQHKVTCDTCDEPNPVATTFKGLCSLNS